MSPYEKSKQEMPIDSAHPIRCITWNWPTEKRLTMVQWAEVCPRLMEMLDKCTLEESIDYLGADDVLKNVEEAKQALEHQVDTAVEDTTDTNLEPYEEKHVHALEWAFGMVVKKNLVEPRIQKIIGAALTCQIGSPKCFKPVHAKVGFSMIQIPKQEGNLILTECLKAYCVLDNIEHWAINGFENQEYDLGKVIDGRHYLACIVMIDMQANIWLEKAKKHLNTIGLGNVEGLLLGEDDILSRSELLQPARGRSGVVTDLLHSVTCKLPLAFNNDNNIGKKVGFACVRGRVLAALGPMMFTSSQSAKVGVNWQLVDNYAVNAYCSVWLSVGTTFILPFTADVGSAILKAYGECREDMLPFMNVLSDDQVLEMIRLTGGDRDTVDYPPPIDESDEEY